MSGARCENPVKASSLKGSSGPAGFLSTVLPPDSRAGFFLLLAAGLASALTLGFTVVAARLLEPVHYSAFMALFGLWSLLSVPTATLQLVAARHLARPGSLATGFRRQMTRWLGVTLLVVSLPVVALVWFAAEGLGLTQTVAVSVALQALWLGTAVAWLRGRAQAQESFVRFGLSDAVAATLRLGSLGLLLGFTQFSYQWGLFVSLGLGSLATFAVLPPKALTRDAAPLELRTLAASAGSAFLVTLALGVLTNLDLLWARYALDGPQAGFFAAGTLASRPFILLGAVAGTVMLPKVASGATRHAELLKTALFLLAGGLVLAAVAHLFAAPLVTLFFGETYRAAVHTARAAAWGGALVAPVVMLANARLGLERSFAAAGFALFTVAQVAAVFALALFALAPSGPLYWVVCGVLSTVYLALSLFRSYR